MPNWKPRTSSCGCRTNCLARNESARLSACPSSASSSTKWMEFVWIWFNQNDRIFASHFVNLLLPFYKISKFCRESSKIKCSTHQRLVDYARQMAQLAGVLRKLNRFEPANPGEQFNQMGGIQLGWCWRGEYGIWILFDFC